MDLEHAHEHGQDHTEEQEEYINPNEVQEEIAEDINEPEPIEDDDDMDIEEINNDHGEDDDGEDYTERIEIDMSNNSWAYFDQHKDSVFTIFKHPSLPVVVTGGGDNTAYMWTTHSQPPKFVTELTGHKESVVAGGFTSDGDYCITGDMAGRIQVFKSFKKGQQWKIFGEIEEVAEIAWIKVHPKQPVFAFGGMDGSVWVYQITPSLEQIMSGFSHQAECNGGLFININDLDALNLVTISEDGSIIIWNCYTGQVEHKISTHDFKGLSPPWVSITQNNENNIVAIGSRDGNIAILNTETGNIVNFFQTIELSADQDVSEASIEALSFCDTQPFLAIGLVSGDMILFDTKNWKPRRSMRLDDAVTKLQFLENSPILIGSSMDGKIYKWDSRTGEELFVGVGHNMGVLDFAVLENGKKLITAGDEGVSLVFVHE